MRATALHRRIPLAILVLVLAAGTAELSAKEYALPPGGFVDLPAGFEQIEEASDGVRRFCFSDFNGVMEFDIVAYPAGKYKKVEELAAERISDIKSSESSTPFSYEGRAAVFAILDFPFNEGRRKGIGVFILGRSPAATPSGKASAAGAPRAAPTAEPVPPESSFALLAHAPAEAFDAYAGFILSCVDAFSIDAAARRAPGPLSQFLLPWPPERPGPKRVALPGGGSVELPWSDEEAQQEADTVNREYGILTSYAQADSYLQIEAWTRFYKMVYRESAARLDRLALEFARVLPWDDPTEAARRVLAWAQDFAYERDPSGSDLVPPLTAAYEARGDCDARAVTAAILLERLKIDTILMVSPAFKHSLFAVDVPGGGVRFALGDKKYLVAETTTKEHRLGLGQMFSEHADGGKWFGVDLGR